jgi:hypothetical protein
MIINILYNKGMLHARVGSIEQVIWIIQASASLVWKIRALDEKMANCFYLKYCYDMAYREVDGLDSEV